MVVVPLWFVALMPAAGASSVAFTIKAAHHAEVDFTKSEKIFGTATTGGAPAAGQQVDLWANAFPYKAFKKVATTTTSSTGGYTFKQSPTHNTKYRVALKTDPTDRSSTVMVYVDPLYFGETFVGKATSVHVSYKMRYPTDITEKGRPVYWYFGLNHASRLKHVATSRYPAPIKPGLIKISHTFKVPAGWDYAQWQGLDRDQPKHGFGRPVCLGPLVWDLGKSTCTPPKSISAKTHR